MNRYRLAPLIHFIAYVLFTQISYYLLLSLEFGSGFFIKIMFVVFSLVFSLILMSLFSPLILRYLFEGKELRDNIWKEKIDNIFKKANIKPPKIYLISLAGTYNALISGTFNFTQTLFITKNILEDMRDDEVESIIKHEIGHIQLHHINRRLSMIFVSTILSLALFFIFSYFGIILLPAQLTPIIIMLSALFILSFQMRIFAFQIFHQEIEADTNAVANLGNDINAYCRTLYKLAYLTGIDASAVHPNAKTNPSVAHPSIETRVATLKENIEIIRRKNIKIQSLMPYKYWLEHKSLIPIHTFGLLIFSFFTVYIYLTQVKPTHELFTAVERGDQNRIQKLLNSGVSIDAINIFSYGMTVLNHSIINNQRGMFDLALSYGASITRPSGIFKLEPMIASLYSKDDYYIKKIYPLIKNNSSINLNEFYAMALDAKSEKVISFLRTRPDINRSIASEQDNDDTKK